MSEPLIVTSPEAIRQIVAEALREARAHETPPESPVMTVAQVCELLSCSDKSLRKYISEDGLPAHRLGPHWRFFRHEVLEWLAGREGG